MPDREVTYVRKACAYVTRGDRELLVFEGPDEDRLQVPKGTVEPDETPREALRREVAEESGIRALDDVSHLATDVWPRRPSKRYVRHFYRVPVDDPRDRWTHEVTGDGAEAGSEFEYRWIDLPTDREFALDLDEYLDRIGGAPRRASRK